MSFRRRVHLRPRGASGAAAELREELEAHVALCVERLVARGVPPADALRQARARFGDYDAAVRTLTTSVHERERRMQRRDWLDTLGQDLRFALNQMRRARGFTAVVVLTLGLGIGATTAVFTVVREVLLRELPFDRPDRLVRAWAANPAREDARAPLSVPDVEDWARDAGAPGASLERVAAFSTLPSGLVLADPTVARPEPARLRTAYVSADFFATLGVRAQLGRLPLPAEFTPGRDRVVVLSDATWRARFGADPSVVGRTVRLNDEPYTVLGVAPRAVRFPSDPEVWAPFTVIPETGIPRVRGNRWLQVVGRLRPGVTPERARADLQTLARRAEAEYPDTHTGWTGATVVPLRDDVVGDARGRLLVLFGAVGLVLVLACVNVANLLLARASSRVRELAVRTALGAGRPRLARQLLTESVLLALAGGALGVALAWWGAGALVRRTAAWMPPTGDVRPDGLVLAFALGISALTGVAFGLIPATRGLEGVAVTLREGGRGSSGGRRAHALRRAFVAAQVALAVTLVVGAGLFVKSFARLSRVDLGFDAERTVAVKMTIPNTRYASSATYLPALERMMERVRAVPGVASVAAIKDAPFLAPGAGELGPFAVPSRPDVRPEDRPQAHFLPTTPGLFRALGVPLLAGRDLAAGDADTLAAGVVLSASAARLAWRDRDPRTVVGEQIVREGRTLRVVGVVADARFVRVDSAAWPAAYVPYALMSRRIATIVASTRGDPAAVLPAVRAALRAVEPDQPVTAITTMRDAVRGAVAAPRFLTLLVGAFGAVALLLAALGVYGVVAYVVGERTREIGVRMALGARAGDVVAWTLRAGMAPVVVGLAGGVVGAFALARLVAAQLFEVSPGDPVVFAAVAGLLALVSLLASWLPARRATRVGPVAALGGD